MANSCTVTAKCHLYHLYITISNLKEVIVIVIRNFC